VLSFKRPVTGAEVRNNCGVLSPCPQFLTGAGTVDVLVATVQTIAVVEHDPRIFASFGVLVVDEVHSVCGRVFSNALRCAPCSRILALSATPERRDGLHVALPWLAGEEVARVRRTWERVDVDALTYKGGPQVTLKLYNGQLNLAAMINRLCADDQRTARIAAVVHAHRLQGRCILVLSERVEHLESLRGALKAMGLSETGLLVGATPMAERAAQSAFPVLFATYPMCKQGFDKPQLDTLVMATPITSLEQVVGRILRAHPTKQQPLVVDVVDPFSIFAGEARKRQRYYSDERYQVNAGSL
jgi:superfamily II DNA or RNA helicase